MITAVDTNVLVEYLAGDEDMALRAQNAISAQETRGSLIIATVVYAELLPYFDSENHLESILQELRVDVDKNLGVDVWKLAAAKWSTYLERRKSKEPAYYCLCGHARTFSCEACGALLGGPRHILADFLIGAHATLKADALLTNRGIYPTYFPQLKQINY